MDLLINSDQILVVTGVERRKWDYVTAAFIHDVWLPGATVTVTVKDSDETDVAGPLTLTYVTGSDGDFEVVLQDTVTLIEGNRYLVDIEIDGGADTKLVIREPMIAKYQEAA